MIDPNAIYIKLSMQIALHTAIQVSAIAGFGIFLWCLASKTRRKNHNAVLCSAITVFGAVTLWAGVHIATAGLYVSGLEAGKVMAGWEQERLTAPYSFLVYGVQVIAISFGMLGMWCLYETVREGSKHKAAGKLALVCDIIVVLSMLYLQYWKMRYVGS